MIYESLATPRASVGFVSRTTVNRSPEMLSKTRLALACAKAGDEVAMRFLYVNYAHNVYGYVRPIVRDEYEAEDLTQHVFTKLLTRLPKYDDTGGEFFAWLLRLARNVAIDHLRVKRALPTEQVGSPRAGSGPGSHAVEAVRDALATLPEAQRQVGVLRHLAGLTPAEIAERMGRTTGSVNSLHHRARQSLRNGLTQLDSAPSTCSTGRWARMPEPRKSTWRSQ